MKLNYSISLKLTLIVVLVSIIIIFSLVLINFQEQLENEEYALDVASNKAVYDFAETHYILEELENNMSVDKINDKILLERYLSNLTKNLSSIQNINVNLIENSNLTIYFSLNRDERAGDKPQNLDLHNSSYLESHTFYMKQENAPVLSIITPINITGSNIGTYEIKILINPPVIPHNEQIQNIVLITFFFILILIVSLLFLLRRVIVRPITIFRDKAEIIGKGNLDTEIEIDSNDELGDLARAFNQMTVDLKESRTKIEEYNKILEGLLDQKDEFIGQLGHDLKNPLQPLVGLLPIIKEQEKDPKIKETLEVMQTNAEYMRDLIFSTLELAKLRSSNIEFDMVDLKLRDEAEKVVESQKLLLKENKIKVVNKIDDGILVVADKLRLSEVFKNLITNSVKYTPDKGGTITLDAKTDEDIVTVSVQDTGIGMTEEQLRKVFDEFYKADRYSSDYHSTGLGMAIAKRIVEHHKGKIWVESPGPGKGSTFYFTLKLS